MCLIKLATQANGNEDGIGRIKLIYAQLSTIQLLKPPNVRKSGACKQAVHGTRVRLLPATESEMTMSARGRSLQTNTDPVMRIMLSTGSTQYYFLNV